MALPPYISVFMQQTATYWAPGVNDGFGGMTSYAAPILIQCRWQDEEDLFINDQGEEETSNTVVYPDRELAVKGVLALGSFLTFLDPKIIETSVEIRQIGASPSLKGEVQLNKCWL